MSELEKAFEDWKKSDLIQFHFQHQAHDCWTGFMGGHRHANKQLQSKITTLESQLAESRQEAGRLSEALKRYASDEFWMKVSSYEGCGDLNWGDVAKAALKG